MDVIDPSPFLINTHFPLSPNQNTLWVSAWIGAFVVYMKSVTSTNRGSALTFNMSPTCSLARRYSTTWESFLERLEPQQWLGSCNKYLIWENNNDNNCMNYVRNSVFSALHNWSCLICATKQAKWPLSALSIEKDTENGIRVLSWCVERNSQGL